MIKYKTKVLFMNKWIMEHPDLSSNEVYKHWKGKKHSYRKQNMLATYRSVHSKPEPTLRKRIISTPIKYRKRKIKIKEPVDIPETQALKGYDSFYHALDVMVVVRGKPKNFADMRHLMYQSKFKSPSGGYPNKPQSLAAWNYLVKKRKRGEI